MRMFFITVGILSWLLALAVAWIFAENGGVMTVIAAGIFAGLAVVSLGLERILKLLEEIRDRAQPPGRDRRSRSRSNVLKCASVKSRRRPQVLSPLNTLPQLARKAAPEIGTRKQLAKFASGKSR